MFLGTIKEFYRQSVLDLALYIAEPDNEFSESEKVIIDTYKIGYQSVQLWRKRKCLD
jgi:hypothetical protein